MNTGYTIKPLSERALLVQFNDVLSEAINARVIALHETLLKNPFPGYVESVPGYSSLGVFFNMEEISLEASFERVQESLHHAVAQIEYSEKPVRNIIEIPVRYGGTDGPDIEYVAAQNSISVEEVIALHSENIYSVFMLGFLPGFPYMGITNKKLTVERKASPRLRVPAGSVALAGNQTGIYPEDSPGGWQIIGRTDMVLFDALKQLPNFLQAGDRVRFRPV